MLHNKYVDILKQFLGDYTKEIYGRELVKKINLSQKGIALTLEDIKKQAILKSRKRGNLKLYQLNLENAEVKDILIVIEFLQKKEFLKKQRVMAHLFKEDERIVGIFGSYAKGLQKEGSDIDLFIIGKKIPKDYGEKAKIFDLDVSVRYFSEKDWVSLVKKKDNLWKEIISSHILLFGMERFVNVVWKEYYGFD